MSIAFHGASSGPSAARSSSQQRIMLGRTRSVMDASRPVSVTTVASSSPHCFSLRSVVHLDGFVDGSPAGDAAAGDAAHGTRSRTLNRCVVLSIVPDLASTRASWALNAAKASNMLPPGLQNEARWAKSSQTRRQSGVSSNPARAASSAPSNGPRSAASGRDCANSKTATSVEQASRACEAVYNPLNDFSKPYPTKE